jgi:hypothetical protein
LTWSLRACALAELNRCLRVAEPRRQAEEDRRSEALRDLERGAQIILRFLGVGGFHQRDLRELRVVAVVLLVL